MGSYVQREAFWVGINCCVSAVDTTEKKGALSRSGGKPTGRGSSDTRTEVTSYTKHV